MEGFLELLKDVWDFFATRKKYWYKIKNSYKSFNKTTKGLLQTKGS